jgi:bifunctional DNA-binding transcriptional regulator/antitoxin component of YhaV-PrlF toxin-antitoxin module
MPSATRTRFGINDGQSSHPIEEEFNKLIEK